MFNKLKYFYESENNNFKKILTLIYHFKIENKLTENEVIDLKKKMKQNDEELSYLISTLKLRKKFEDGISYFENYTNDIFGKENKIKIETHKIAQSFKNISNNEDGKKKKKLIYNNSIIDEQLYSKKVKNQLGKKKSNFNKLLDK